MKTLQRGFTLIELLVVIAIIGILSSIVLASLSSARSKGTDAAITSTLSNMRAQAELYYANNNQYDTAANTSCTGGIFANTGVGGLSNLTTDLRSKAGASNVTCTSSTTAWAVNAKLTSGSVGYACADSSGNSLSSSTKASAYTITTGVCN